jgi:polar amino acid transport system ATP-binding protein
VIHERGTPAEIFGDPTQDRTRQFLERIIDAGRM